MLVIALTFPSSPQTKEIATAATVINEEMSAIEQFVTVSNLLHNFLQISSALREKCPYLGLFWSVFSRIRTKYGETLRISSNVGKYGPE